MPARVSVNVSASQLHEYFPDAVRDALDRHHARPEQLIVEVTESATMRDPARTGSILGGLRAAGVAVAIDDFGAGLCSLGRLSGLPVDYLKLDRSLLSEVPDSPKQAALVASVVPMADALGVALIAEGVETEAQRKFLAARATGSRRDSGSPGRCRPPR